MVTIGIKSETIIHRMMDELVKAKEQKNNVKDLNRHIENVQLLCDIILADERGLENMPTTQIPTRTSSEITEQEIKAMMIGQQTKSNMMKTEQLKQLNEQSNYSGDEDESDGGSIFDF